MSMAKREKIEIITDHSGAGFMKDNSPPGSRKSCLDNGWGRDWPPSPTLIVCGVCLASKGPNDPLYPRDEIVSYLGGWTRACPVVGLRRWAVGRNQRAAVESPHFLSPLPFQEYTCGILDLCKELCFISYLFGVSDGFLALEVGRGSLS